VYGDNGGDHVNLEAGEGGISLDPRFSDGYQLASDSPCIGTGLKAQGAHLRFVMLTGVSKFSKVSLFSGLNNLEDITLDSRYGSLCGYTQEELESVFVEYLDGVDLRQVKKWYNGYNFLGESVYNPFDILLYLSNRHPVFSCSHAYGTAAVHPGTGGSHR
jgi:hypothetical protein